MAGITEQDRRKKLDSLYNQVLAGKRYALMELSYIAWGGNPEARRLIGIIDGMKIQFAKEEPAADREKPNLIRRVLQPVVSLIETKVRQVMVGCDLEQAPPYDEPGCTQEDFPNLPLFRAQGILNRARKRQKEHSDTEGISILNKGGVPFEAWSKTDQELLRQGKKPRGVPLHPNI